MTLLIRSLSILLYTSSDILADLWYFLRRLSLIVTPHWWCQLTNQSEPQLAPLPTYWENSKKYYRTFCRNIAKYYYATPTPYIIQNLICVLNKNIFRLFFLNLLIFTPFNLKIVPANQIPFSFIDWSKNWKLLLRDFFVLVMDPIEGKFFFWWFVNFKGSETTWKTEKKFVWGEHHSQRKSNRFS